MGVYEVRERARIARVEMDIKREREERKSR